MDDIFRDTNLQFSEQIMRHTLLDKFEVPRISLYAGLTDLAEHLETFRAMVESRSESSNTPKKGMPSKKEAYKEIKKA